VRVISGRKQSRVTIAGAGPSGLAAAITLARAGVEVDVHEAKADVGSRFIGDFQIIENASEAEPVPEFLSRIGIESNFWLHPGTAATFYDHRLRGREIRADRPFGYFLRRGAEEGTLDRGLLAQARELGVNVHFGSRLDPVKADIVATGPASPDGLAKEITFRCDLPETVEVYFDHKRSPGGYSYLFVIDGMATFGCAIVSDFKRIDDYFDASLARAREVRPFSTDRDLRAGYSYMNFHLKNLATSGDSRFVGEAAGFQDYLFGLGIRYALTSGWLAAVSLLENQDFDELWRAQLGGKQETSLVNRFLYEAGGNFGLSLFVRQAARAADFTTYLAGWHRRSVWKRLAVPFIRRLWRHDGRCLHKPGLHWCRSRKTEMKVPPLGPINLE
jgi:flavin-dependent dehydrogenase